MPKYVDGSVSFQGKRLRRRYAFLHNPKPALALARGRQAPAGAALTPNRQGFGIDWRQRDAKQTCKCRRDINGFGLPARCRRQARPPEQD